MSERRATGLSRERQIALVCAGLLLVAILGYFVLISPKRSTAHDLGVEKAQVEAQIERNRTSALAKNLKTIRAADVFRLAKAMPDRVGMPDVILELNQLALASGISFDEIAPAPPTSETSFDIHPISLTFSGNFYSLADFLFRLRNLVQVHDKKLITKGRMFALSGLTFAEGEQKFPQIKAELTVDAFVLGTATAAPAGAPGTTTTPAPASSPPASASAAASSTPTP